MSQYAIIRGGKKLSGTIKPVPNKNSILSALCACILTDKEVIYKNLPKSTDVLKLLEILRLLGAQVDDSNFKRIKICCIKLKSYKVDKELGNLIRASVMLAGPLLVRFGKALIPVPGGCVLGKRSISSHIDVFNKAGVKAEYLKDGYVKFTAPKKIKKEYKIWQFEASVTATENLLMYASGTKSHFFITDAACEPHVLELTRMLMSMGANIIGTGSNKLEVAGGKKLGGCEFEGDPDFVDIGAIIVAAALTKGKITIKGGNRPEIVDGIVSCFEKFNLKIDKVGKDLKVNGEGELFIDPKTSGFALADENLPKLAPRPWPGFPVDLIPVLVVLACKTKGKILIQNWMYETGLEFIKELKSLGANITACDSQKIIVSGPIKFKGGKVTPPAIIQSCKAIFLAALADKAETTIYGIDILKRRYPNVFENYKKLGADIDGPYEMS